MNGWGQKRAACAALGAAVFLIAPHAQGQGVATQGTEGAAADRSTAQALEAVEKVLRGERVSDLDLKGLENAVIKLETTDAGGDLKAAKGVEAPAAEKFGVQRNIYILRFDSGAGPERQLQLLRIQREILKNQLALLKALNTIASYQALLGTRTARVESSMRDITLGMKSSRGEMHKVRGETSATGAKMTDVARETANMSETLVDMAKDIDDIEGAIQSVDVQISKLVDAASDQASATERGMKRMGRGIEREIRDMGEGMQSEMRRMSRDTEGAIGGLKGDLEGAMGDLKSDLESDIDSIETE